MQIRWKIVPTLHNVTFLLWCVANIVNQVGSDKTSCRSSIETGDGLHFICFCEDTTSKSDLISSGRNPFSVDLEPDNDGKNDFSLAKFAYNLSGAYFRKNIHITFQYCRHLTIVLDQNELNRIGSKYFRPDIQVSSCFIEHVYHLDILRSGNINSKQIEIEHDDQTNMIDEYAPPHFKSYGLDLTVYSVALVKVDSGANLTSLVTSTPETILYIDISNEKYTDESHFDAKGFQKRKIFFITAKDLKVPLKEVRFIKDNMNVNINISIIFFSLKLECTIFILSN